MILHVIDNLFPESGGPPTVVIEFARHQARSGRRVAVACGKALRTAQSREDLADRWKGLEIELIDLGSAEHASAAEAFEATIKRLKPRVIHIHCMWEPLVRRSAAIARRNGVPYVISTHGMLHPYALAQKRLKKWVYLTLFGSMISGSEEMFSLNREEAAHVASRFKVKSSVFPNGVEVAEYASADPALFLTKFPQFKAKPFILFVGRIHPIKGIDNLVRSFALARKNGLTHDLAVVGPDDGCKTDIVALVHELGVDAHVHFRGGMFGKLKRSAFAACSIFSHRPRFEGFGITVVEGMAAGKPVVTTAECKLDGAAEANALRMAPDTDEGFAAALLEVASNTRYATELGGRAQDWVRQTLDWEALAAKADESYSAAAARGSRG